MTIFCHGDHFWSRIKWWTWLSDTLPDKILSQVIPTDFLTPSDFPEEYGEQEATEMAASTERIVFFIFIVGDLP